MFLLHEYEPFMSSFVKCFVLRFSSFDLFKIWILSFYLKKVFWRRKAHDFQNEQIIRFLFEDSK